MREVTYAKPALYDQGWLVRAQHAALLARLAIRCALKGHEWRTERPTRCVQVSACRICGAYIGASVEREASCRWYRP